MIPVYRALVRLHENSLADFSGAAFSWTSSPDCRQDIRVRSAPTCVSTSSIVNCRGRDALSAGRSRQGGYDRLIERAGGLDVCLVGIGRNGHVGFNEPAPTLIAETSRGAAARDA